MEVGGFGEEVAHQPKLQGYATYQVEPEQAPQRDTYTQGKDIAF